MRVVLVGPPGSGKTFLLKKLEEKNILTFNSDEFVREIYRINKPGYLAIKETFGPEFVNKKEVDRTKLREAIMKNPNILQRLNEVIHPIIKDSLEQRNNCVAELPIISTSPVKFKYDKIALVTASSEVIGERLEKRNIKNADFLKLILKKWNNSVNYDYIIDTTKGITSEQVEKFIDFFNLNENK